MKSIILLAFLFIFTISAEALPRYTNLSVPFICQAPFGDWSQPYQDACEEAAIIMAMAYVNDQKTISKSQAKKEIFNLYQFQLNTIGKHKDLSASEVAKLIKDYYHYDNVYVKVDPKINDIKQAVASGHLVIAPTAGRLLNNPFFTPPGPIYHMLIIKGFNDETNQFIVNDNGTRRGAGFRYTYNVLMNAIHDWEESKSSINSSKKAIIIVKKPN